MVRRPNHRFPAIEETGVKFTIAVEPGTQTAFGVVVPDLPGCFSAGDTIEEAFDNARQAIEAYCKILAEADKDLPEPKPINEWQADKGYKGWAWGIVDVPIEGFFRAKTRDP